MEAYSPIEFFDKVFDRKLVQMIGTETNRYASQQIPPAAQLGPESRYHAWKDIGERDMLGFLTILLHMGLVDKPEITDYWSSFN